MKRFYFSLFALAVLIQPVLAQPITPIDSIVAVVEEDVVLRSELDASVAAVVSQFTAAGRQLPPRAVLEKQVLDQLIVTKLQLLRADARGVRVSDQEIDSFINDVARKSGITVDQMRRTIIEDGLSWKKFRQDVNDQLATQQLQRRVAFSRVDVSETEIDLHLSSQDNITGEYQLGHILISIPEGASANAIETARDQADKVYQELQDGMDFVTAAITYSNGPQALQGGDLGWRDATQVPSLIVSQISEMEVGDMTRPLRDPSGFHIIRINDYRLPTKMVQEVKAQHIMIEITELVSDGEAEATIRDIYRQLQADGDFAALAKQFSDDTSSANLGGDMGWFVPTQYGPRVAELLSTLEVNEITEPFKTPVGWHLFKKIANREEDRTEEFIRSNAMETIRQRKAEEELILWIRELRDEAYIEYRI